MSSHNDPSDITYQSLYLGNFFNRFHIKADEIQTGYCSLCSLGVFGGKILRAFFLMDSEDKVEIVNKDNSSKMTIEDQSVNTGTDVLEHQCVVITDTDELLSVPPTTSKSEDKTSGLAFPSVRQLIHQFDTIVERKSDGRPSHGPRLTTSSDDYKINVKDIKFRFEVNTIGDINTERLSAFSGEIDVLRKRKRNRTYSLKEEPSSQTLFDVNRRSSCVDNGLPNNIEESLNTLRIRPLHATEMVSLSDSDLRGRSKDSDTSILPRLDSGTSDLSFEGFSGSFSSWTKDETTKESKRKLFTTALSTSPTSPAVSSPTMSVENFSLSRSHSCGFLSLSSDGSRKRSNSSDSAVEVEDESRFCFDSGGSISRSLAQADASNQGESSFFSNNFWRDKLRLSFPVTEQKTSSLNKSDDDVVLRESALAHRTHRTPSVVISDHSGHSISVHVAYASEDFSLNKVLSTSTPELAHKEILCSRKASDCSSCSSFSAVDRGSCFWTSGVPLSTCSSFSTVDRNSCVWTPGVPLLGSISQRRLSDCSTCSYLTCSEDEVEVSLQQPSPPTLRKNSNWRKVRNVVQWTPFIQTYKRHKYPWVQLAGHQGNFKAGYKQGTIMKKLCQAEETAFEQIQKDILRPFVPEYLGIVEGSDGEKYLQLQDLLGDFSSACVMDIKMGVRTYLEEELAKARHKPKLRKDMYDKMIQIDSNAPTEAEQRAKAVTKPRYMVWRETISSTATLGFRIEGIRRGDGTSSKDFKTTRTREQVMTAISGFIEGHPQAVIDYIQRLKEIREILEKSKFFKSHELIGSSLLFVHNETKSGIWLIDFAKTVPLPDAVKITHTVPWVEGTHEDGYLIGFDNLVDLMECLHRNPPEPKSDQKLPESTHKGNEITTNNVKSTKNRTHEHSNSTSSTITNSTQEHKVPEKNVESIPEESSKIGEEFSGSHPHKPKSKNGNVTGGIERKVVSERKAN